MLVSIFENIYDSVYFDKILRTGYATAYKDVIIMHYSFPQAISCAYKKLTWIHDKDFLFLFLFNLRNRV